MEKKFICIRDCEELDCSNEMHCLLTEKELEDKGVHDCPCGNFPIWKEISNSDIKKRIACLVDIIYDDNCVGGALHIVLDDGNIRSEDINWCLENTIEEMPEGNAKKIYKECAELLLILSYSKRKKLLNDINKGVYLEK